MQTVSFLFFNIILPIFIPIGAGYLLQRKFPLNVATSNQNPILHFHSGTTVLPRFIRRN